MDQRRNNTRCTFVGTKKKTSIVRNMVDGEDIPDLHLQITSLQIQMPRSALAKQIGKVGEGHKRVKNAQHDLSVPINYVAASGKPFRAHQWGTG